PRSLMRRLRPASKFLPRTLPAQVGPYGIRANCIAPETILTERNKHRISSAQQQDLVALHPIRRLGTPADVAHAALYLACDDAAWIAGIILDVTGGAVMVRSAGPPRSRGPTARGGVQLTQRRLAARTNDPT